MPWRHILGGASINRCISDGVVETCFCQIPMSGSVFDTELFPPIGILQQHLSTAPSEIHLLMGAPHKQRLSGTLGIQDMLIHDMLISCFIRSLVVFELVSHFCVFIATPCTIYMLYSIWACTPRSICFGHSGSELHLKSSPAT